MRLLTVAVASSGLPGAVGKAAAPGESMRREVARQGSPTRDHGGVKVSTRGDYAARALLSLALHGKDRPTSVKEIAEGGRSWPCKASDRRDRKSTRLNSSHT